MDEPLLRILQSIKRIEDDPSMQFQTGKIDLASFIPKYHKVFVVDQRCDPNELTIPTATGSGYYAKLSPGILSPEIQPSESHYVTNKLTVALD